MLNALGENSDERMLIVINTDGAEAAVRLVAPGTAALSTGLDRAGEQHVEHFDLSRMRGSW